MMNSMMHETSGRSFAEIRGDQPMRQVDVKGGTQTGCSVCLVDGDDTIIKRRVISGTHERCVDYIRMHCAPEGLFFSIIYDGSGRFASFLC